MKYDMVWNGYTVCPNDWGMKNVSEVFHRIYYVYGGTAYCKYEDKEFCLEAGKLYVFPIMQPYTMWQCPEHPLDVLWFHVEMDIQLCTEIISLQIERDDPLKYLLESMRLLSRDVAYFDDLLRIFDVFLNLLGKRLEIKEYPGTEMKNILNYIEMNIGDALSVEVLADYIGMDRSYFSRKFKSVFQISPNQYIRAKRMKVAARELMQGASVYSAARLVGYNDEKAFSRAFKRYMEISPGRYREIHIMQP